MKPFFALIVSFFLLNGAVWAADEAPPKAAMCVGCHGVNGNSSMPGTPSLAAQNARYIYLQLRDFQEGRRENPMMSPMAADLSRAEMQELANYFPNKNSPVKISKPTPPKPNWAKPRQMKLCVPCAT
jgi:cytochrome c553